MLPDTSSIKTTCPYCGVGCGVVVEQNQQEALQNSILIKGDKDHPANFGRLCSKGSALSETLDHDGRLLMPMVNGEESTWPVAIAKVADKFKSVINKYGPDAVAFYVSGQLLTEDYYVANKLMKGFVGSANIDTNSRLCMSSSVAGHKRAFGSDTVPCCYEDLELCDLLILTGSNAAWCHPVLYQRIVKAKEENPNLFIVVIDPRATTTSDIADLHLQIRPGTDAFLFNGVLSNLHQHEISHDIFLAHCTEGMTDAVSAAMESSPSAESVSVQCGLPMDQVELFFRKYRETEKVVTAYSQGVNQSSSGVDKVNSIINCHLYTGRIGRPGMGPFSFTGQPNAMGGREVGGLANQLAAHMEIENDEHRNLVQSFWSSPKMPDKPGLKAVQLFDNILEGKVKAVWIISTNPAVSLPDVDKVRKALSTCEFVVVSDCNKHTDTNKYADVLLPAATWGEKEGTVTNSERRISRQRKFMPSPGQSKPDWWIICAVARSMGFEKEFNYQNSYEVFLEHAKLSGYQNNGDRDFDISPLSNLTQDQYADLSPIQWPITGELETQTESPASTQTLTLKGQSRFFRDGKFFTSSAKAQFIAINPRLPVNQLTDEYPFVLNTGRLRDQWHTMTRTGKSVRLSSHDPEPFLAVNPDDAKKMGLREGELVRVSSHYGSASAVLKVSDQQLPGNLFMPIHWNRQFASESTVGSVVNPACDPISGQPEFKHTPVKLEKLQVTWNGYILSRRCLEKIDADFWVNSVAKDHWYYRVGGSSTPENWAAWSRNLLCNSDDDINWVEYFDGKNNYRAVRFTGGRLESCIFISSSASVPALSWISSMFGQDAIAETERSAILSGKPPVGSHQFGKIVCSCFGVDENTICKTIAEKELLSVKDIGTCLQAGTNCGSCIPELKKLLASNLADNSATK